MSLHCYPVPVQLQEYKINVMGYKNGAKWITKSYRLLIDLLILGKLVKDTTPNTNSKFKLSNFWDFSIGFCFDI